jgi:DNA repair protein RecO (recombination protein O)
MKRVQLESAYLLSLRPYRETSALLEVFTAPHGRVGLVARGVRGPKSRQRGLFQPFRQLLLSWSEGGDLGTVTGAEAAEPAVALEGEAVFSGWYLNELLLRLLQRRDPHAALFHGYAKALRALGEARAQVALRIFEKQLLTELGYGLQLPACVESGAWYEFGAESGARQLPARIAGAYQGSSLLDLMNENFQSDESLRDARRLLRAALLPHLGERELVTPRLLRSLRRAVKPVEQAHA